jgi:hypothetical protein
MEIGGISLYNYLESQTRKNTVLILLSFQKKIREQEGQIDSAQKVVENGPDNVYICK